MGKAFQCAIDAIAIILDGCLMKDTVVIFGADGYIGWPLALHLGSMKDKRIVLVDNFVTRELVRSVGSDSLVPIANMPKRIATYERLTGRKDLVFVEAD